VSPGNRTALHRREADLDTETLGSQVTAEVGLPASPHTLGFFERVCRGKVEAFADPWGDERDLLTSMQQLDRAIALYEGVIP